MEQRWYWQPEEEAPGDEKQTVALLHNNPTTTTTLSSAPPATASTRWSNTDPNRGCWWVPLTSSFSSPLQFELQTATPRVYRWKLELEEAVGFPPSTCVNSANEFRCFPGRLCWLLHPIAACTHHHRNSSFFISVSNCFQAGCLAVWRGKELILSWSFTVAEKCYVGSFTAPFIHSADSKSMLGQKLWINVSMRRSLKELQVDKSLLISQCMDNVISSNYFRQINFLARQ